MWISTVHSEEKLASKAQFYSVRKKTMKEGHGLPEADRKIRQTDFCRGTGEAVPSLQDHLGPQGLKARRILRHSRPD
jgi:hypothetical protein